MMMMMMMIMIIIIMTTFQLRNNSCQKKLLCNTDKVCKYVDILFLHTKIPLKPLF